MRGSGWIKEQASNEMNIPVKMLLLIALFAALTAVGGFIRIPIPPVPITLQTLFVYLAAHLLGTKGSVASQILFLIVGLLGVPIFTAGGGPGYILKPSFGYLVGFPIGAMVIGLLTEKLKDSLDWWKLFIVTCTGMLIILFIGVFYLYVNMNFILQTEITWNHALWIGVAVFLPGEMVKMFIAIHLVRKLKSHVQLLKK